MSDSRGARDGVGSGAGQAPGRKSRIVYIMVLPQGRVYPEGEFGVKFSYFVPFLYRRIIRKNTYIVRFTEKEFYFSDQLSRIP